MPQVCQPLAIRPPKRPFAAADIGVEPLRVVGTRELQQFGLAERARAGLDDLAGVKLGELHCAARARRRNQGLTR